MSNNEITTTPTPTTEDALRALVKKIEDNMPEWAQDRADKNLYWVDCHDYDFELDLNEAKAALVAADRS